VIAQNVGELSSYNVALSPKIRFFGKFDLFGPEGSVHGGT